jgi:hypothetical protein
MHRNATPAGSSGRAEASEHAEANGRPDGIPEATVARLPVYLRALYGMAERGISTVAAGSGTTSTTSSTRCPGRLA